ncbi:MAG: glutamine amidotransferase-related protein [Solirubrobacteraceae bacterium]
MRVRIALIGDENNAFPSHREINAVRGMLGQDVDAEWLATDGDRVRDLGGFHGIWLTPGSPYADDTAAYQAVEWARERDVPFLGTCGGLQYALIEYFRNVLHVPSASHAESDGIDDKNVVRALACSLYGEQRVIRPISGTRFSRLVNDKPFVGMHYCNYGPGSEELRRLVEGGMVIEATAEDAEAEVIELPRNRFFMLTLFQPQIGALARQPVHPVLCEFVRCAGLRAAAGYVAVDLPL